jgi:hypothetical protein
VRDGSVVLARGRVDVPRGSTTVRLARTRASVRAGAEVTVVFHSRRINTPPFRTRLAAG